MSQTLEEAPAPAEPAPEASPRARRQMPDWLKGNVLLFPAAAWFAVLLIVPMLIVVQYSLARRGIIKPVRFSWSNLQWHNYQDAFSSRFRRIFVRSIFYAGATTIACVALGFPLAYWIARFGGRFRNVFLVLVIIPFLTSYLIRMYAWQFILQRDGLLNDTLGALHLGNDHVFLNTSFAVILGLTYGFLPFMILPLYVALEKIDIRLIEAAEDLYADRRAAFRRVTLPLALPGVFAGSLLTFIPAMGDYINADLLGNPSTRMIGNVIQNRLLLQNDYPVGSALSFILMAGILVAVAVYARALGTEQLTG